MKIKMMKITIIMIIRKMMKIMKQILKCKLVKQQLNNHYPLKRKMERVKMPVVTHVTVSQCSAIFDSSEARAGCTIARWSALLATLVFG